MTRDEPAPGESEPRLAWKPLAAEARIIAVLVAQREAGEQYEVAFRRKEAALGAIFAELDALDSLELQRRVSSGLPGDVLAERFGRLTADRRARLIAFLVAARRRFAVASACELATVRR